MLEFWSVCFAMGKETVKKDKSVFFNVLLSICAVFALHCRFEVIQGSFPEAPALNGLHKLSQSFNNPDFTDLLVFGAVYSLLKYVSGKDKKVERGTGILSLILSFLLVWAICFKRHNSAEFMFGNSFQLLLAVFCIVGFGIVIYSVIRCIHYLFEKNVFVNVEESERQKTGKHFLLIGFGIIVVGWLPWIILNYPGSHCPDSMWQLQQFLGDAPWSSGQPPFSTAIMGVLFVVGRFLINENFGVFLYCLFQTIFGAWVFSLSMQKLYKLGIPGKWCMVGNLFFALTPLWGTYAQWLEKDLLYAEMVVLQTVCMMEVFVKRQCDKKDIFFLGSTSLGAALLRSNGIYAIFPTLLLMTIRFRGKERKRLAVVFLSVFILYEGVVGGIYPALGLGGGSVAEVLSIPLQQTARYVCEHTEELTEYEKQVIEREFGNIDIMYGYDPVISDPIKNYFRCVDLKDYFAMWFQMFMKHPGTYVDAFVNKSYGYMAPVSQNIEAWIQREYFNYMTDLGIYRVMDVNVSNFLVYIWHSSMMFPLVKYLCTPGLYTWIVVVLVAMLIKRKNYSAVILFVPSFVNILVCIASPLATAIRYELPTVASVPLLIGWTYYSLHNAAKTKESSSEGPLVIESKN